MEHDLEEFRGLVSAAKKCLNALILAENDPQIVIQLQALQSILDQIGTDIDNQLLLSRATAIQKLIGALGGSSQLLKDAHDRVVELKDGLGVATKFITAFGGLVAQLSAPR